VSDTVLVAIVGAIPGIIASILGYMNKREIRKSTALSQKNEQHLHEAKEAISETKDAMHLLEKNTNSIKDELVKATAIASEAIGNLKGRAELRAENKGDDKPPEPEEHSG
jgi:hypothetical protein